MHADAKFRHRLPSSTEVIMDSETARKLALKRWNQPVEVDEDEVKAAMQAIRDVRRSDQMGGRKPSVPHTWIGPCGCADCRKDNASGRPKSGPGE